MITTYTIFCAVFLIFVRGCFLKNNSGNAKLERRRPKARERKSIEAPKAPRGVGCGEGTDSNLLRVWFQDGIFEIDGSNSAISGFAKFNRYEGKTMREE